MYRDLRAVPWAVDAFNTISNAYMCIHKYIYTYTFMCIYKYMDMYI
jgi:hypothetical protein